MIIDDEPDLRRSLALILRAEGYLVSEAGSVKEGIQLLQGGNFNLIFLDMKLPDASGITIFPILQRFSPDLPVIILTGHATLETAIAAVHQGRAITY